MDVRDSCPVPAVVAQTQDAISTRGCCCVCSTDQMRRVTVPSRSQLTRLHNYRDQVLVLPLAP